MLAGAGEPAGTDAGADVTVAVAGLRSAKGDVLVCLTRAANAFPDCRKDAASLKVKIAARDAARVRFVHVAPGRWAVAAVHDENGNGRMDKVMAMPREGYGFSRDAPVRMGPPRFTDAAFTVGEGDVVQPLKMRYIF